MAIKRDQADKWFSDCIRHRAGYQCESCHKGFAGLVQGFECCHIYGRANKSTRWATGNAVALCGGCHRRYTEHPLEFNDFLEGYLGSGHLDLLRERKNQIFKTNKVIRKEISAHYRAEFRRMVASGDTDLVDY
jgi:hypothetical protein